MENRINVSLDEVKSFLRIKSTDEDELLQALLDTAKEHIWNFLNNDFTETDSETGEVTYQDIPRTVEHAVKMLVAYLYEKRTPGIESEKTGELSVKWNLPVEIQYLLAPYRRIPGL